MRRQEVLLLVVFAVVPVHAYPEKSKICPHNMVVNGTNLISQYRKQILVMGITHLGCQACRNQAVRYERTRARGGDVSVSRRASLAYRYNDLHRDLEFHNIREPEVRLILVNEQQAAQYLPGMNYGKIRLFQDNYRDRAIEKLGYYGQRLNNLIFGR